MSTVEPMNSMRASGIPTSQGNPSGSSSSFVLRLYLPGAPGSADMAVFVT